MKELAQFVMRGRVQAMLLAALFGSVPLILLPVLYLSGAALGLVVLRKNNIEALNVVLGAGLLVVIVSVLMPEQPGISFPLIFLLWPPVWLCCLVLRKTESQSMVLLVVAGITSVFVVAMHILIDDVGIWWGQWLENSLLNTTEYSLNVLDLESPMRLANGLVAMIYGISIMCSTLLARWWQAILHNPGGFRTEFHVLRLPNRVLLLFGAVLMLAASLNQQILSDLFVVAIMTYFFLGLAVIHGVTSNKRLGIRWLIPIYIAMMFLPPYTLVGLSVLGVADTFMDFRAKK